MLVGCLVNCMVQRTNLGLVPDRVIDHIVIFDNFLLDSVLQIHHPRLHLLKVDVAKAAIEEHLTRVELKQQPKLGVVDEGVTAEVQKCVIEVRQCFFEITEEEIRDSLLKIRHGKILVKLNRALVTLDLGSSC